MQASSRRALGRSRPNKRWGGMECRGDDWRSSKWAHLAWILIPCANLSPLEQRDLPGRTSWGSGPQWDTTRYKMRAKSNLLLVQDAKVNGTHLKLDSQEPKSILPSRRHCRQCSTATKNKQQQRFRKSLSSNRTVHCFFLKGFRNGPGHRRQDEKNCGYFLESKRGCSLGTQPSLACCWWQA